MNYSPPATTPASQPGTPPGNNGERGNDKTTAPLIRYLDGPDGCMLEMVTLERAHELIGRGGAKPIMRRGKLYRIMRVPKTRPLLKPLPGFAAPTFLRGRTMDAGEHNLKTCKGYSR
jgi:hypothetical protein